MCPMHHVVPAATLEAEDASHPASHPPTQSSCPQRCRAPPGRPQEGGRLRSRTPLPGSHRAPPPAGRGVAAGVCGHQGGPRQCDYGTSAPPGKAGAVPSAQSCCLRMHGTSRRSRCDIEYPGVAPRRQHAVSRWVRDMILLTGSWCRRRREPGTVPYGARGELRPP